MKAIALAAAVGMLSGVAVTKPGVVGWAKHKVASVMCSQGQKNQAQCGQQQAQKQAMCAQMAAAKQALCAQKQAQCAQAQAQKQAQCAQMAAAKAGKQSCPK